MTQRRRMEAQTLERLSECDQDLIGQCDLLHTVIARSPPAEIATSEALVREGLAAIHETLRRRASILL